MSNTITLPTMISVKQASAQFGLTPYFLRSLCHDGKIRYIKVSKNRWLLNAALPITATESRRNPPSPTPCRAFAVSPSNRKEV